MAMLEGIVKLRGKKVVLENISNFRLRTILHSRLRGDRFNFRYGDSEGYTAHTESKEAYDDSYKDTHVDKHKDNYTDKHRDNHTDKSSGYGDVYESGEHSESMLYHDHTDRGHNETIEYGYDEHTDGYN